MDTSERIVQFCNDLTYENLSPEVIDRVKYLALDFLGVSARGSEEISSQTIYDFLRSIGESTKDSVVIGTRLRSSCEYAALANGGSAHALEMDDVSNESSSHPGSAVFPTAFAVGEVTKCDGRRFIEGVVCGYEVMVRLGRALNPASHYARGFHPTGTCGTLAAAIVASKLFGLNTEQMLNALGIAGSQASGSMEFLSNGAWSKRLHPGWAAHSGIIAARLAQRGFIGPDTILEGRFGFLHAYSDSSDARRLLDQLGESFAITRISIKPHACCRYKHGPIDGIIEVMRENELKPLGVDSITLGILKAGFPIIAEPEKEKVNPKTVYEAQFSMPFGAAVAALYGRASIEEYSEANLNSPVVKDMMKRVFCIIDPELDKEYPSKWPASVEIRMKDGRRFFGRVEYPKGDPENFLSWEELTNKFNRLSSGIFSEERRKEIISRIRSIEEISNIATVARLFLC